MNRLHWVYLVGIQLLVVYTNSFAQQSMNLPLLAHWDDDSIPAGWTGSYSECWGYDANGREYAFLASTQGTYFFDITNPSSLVLIDFIRTKDTTTLVVNKDYATYSHYLYAVSDQGDNSLQIFDLQYLPDSVVVAYDENTISKRCHTVFVEKDRLYMCSNTRNDGSFGAMDVFSLADPLNPQLMGTLYHPGFVNVHEVFVQNDTAYCANGYKGLWIYDMKFPSAPVLLSILDYYPESGYNHSAWLTADSKTMVFTDEDHGKGVKVFDMSDLEDPQPLSLLRSNLLQVSNPFSDDGSVAHNPYIVGNVLLVSYYHDGVMAYDISNPSLPVRIAYYDTEPDNTSYYSYSGCWGLYPFLPSGNIIASDIKNGLYILNGKNVLNYQPESPVAPGITIGMNSVPGHLEVIIVSASNEVGSLMLYDISGRKVTEKRFTVSAGYNKFEVSIPALTQGMYVVRVNSGAMNYTGKVVKSNH